MQKDSTESSRLSARFSCTGSPGIAQIPNHVLRDCKLARIERVELLDARSLDWRNFYWWFPAMVFVAITFQQNANRPLVFGVAYVGSFGCGAIWSSYRTIPSYRGTKSYHHGLCPVILCGRRSQRIDLRSNKNMKVLWVPQTPPPGWIELNTDGLLQQEESSKNDDGWWIPGLCATCWVVLVSES